MDTLENVPQFADANANAKLVRQIVRLFRRARLDYESFRRVCAQARRDLGLSRPRRPRRLPHILPEASLKKFYDTVERSGELQHEIMLKLLF